MSEPERLKITIEDLEDEEKPLVAEETGHKAADVLTTAGKRVTLAAGEVARRAWESDVRHKTTDRLSDAASAVTQRTAEAVRDKMVTAVEEQARATVAAAEARAREVDWRAEAQKAAVNGLRWLGQRLEQLAERFNRPAEDKQP